MTSTLGEPSAAIGVVSTPAETANSLPPRRRLRICHLSQGLCTGGLERLLVEFAKFYNREGFELSFLALEGLGRPADDIRDLGCPVQSLDTARVGRWERFARLRQALRQIQPDILHTHNARPHVLGTLAARLTGVPLVCHTRHGQRFGQTWRARGLFRLAACGVDRIVAVSEDAARLCRTEDRIPSGQVQRIWNGIDLRRFAYRGPSGQPTAISVARLSSEKDFPTLLRSVAQVVARRPDFRLWVVGDGPERGALTALCRELHLEDHVQFWGERADIPDLLRQASVFVSSSLTEGISLTLLEAMACGLPVIATAVGGNPEIVVPGATGWLVPPREPAALAQALRAFLDCPGDWGALGAAGRVRVETEFDAQQMVRNYERLYGTLWARRAPRGSLI